MRLKKEKLLVRDVTASKTRNAKRVLCRAQNKKLPVLLTPRPKEKVRTKNQGVPE